jgi:hypothetical protein
MDAEVRDNILHQVTPGRPIRVYITSGYRQPSGTSLQIGTEIQTPDSGILEDEGVLIAEDGATIRFKVLYCVTVVQDRREDHNETSLTYQIGDGDDDVSEYRYALTAKEDFGQTRYLINFHFV